MLSHLILDAVLWLCHVFPLDQKMLGFLPLSQLLVGKKQIILFVEGLHSESPLQKLVDVLILVHASHVALQFLRFVAST